MKFTGNNDTFAADAYCSLSDMAEALFEDIWDDEEDEYNAEYDASAINRTVEKNIEDHARKLGHDWLSDVKEKFIDSVKENVKQVNSVNDLLMSSYTVNKIIDCLSLPDIVKAEFNDERNTVNITHCCVNSHRNCVLGLICNAHFTLTNTNQKFVRILVSCMC